MCSDASPPDRVTLSVGGGNQPIPAVEGADPPRSLGELALEATAAASENQGVGTLRDVCAWITLSAKAHRPFRGNLQSHKWLGMR